jgi:hypothetical protein
VSLSEEVFGCAGTSLAGHYPANVQLVERNKKAQPVKTSPECWRGGYLRRRKTMSTAAPRPTRANVPGSGSVLMQMPPK